jgi:hypothetical protein
VAGGDEEGAGDGDTTLGWRESDFINAGDMSRDDEEMVR